MRLFVAIDLDEGARRAIAALQERVAEALGADRSIKTGDPAHMHLTLAFLGEIAEPEVPAVVDTLSINIDLGPFAVEFQGLGVFPPRGAPRVLWLGVGRGGSEIIQVERAVASRLERLGVTPERRPFHPHVTLVRWRTSLPSDRQHGLAADPHAPVARVIVDHVTLYQSRLSSAGPVHTALTRANLT